MGGYLLIYSIEKSFQMFAVVIICGMLKFFLNLKFHSVPENLTSLSRRIAPTVLVINYLLTRETRVIYLTNIC